MKKFVVLGGYGEMGRITSRDLAETSKDSEIVIAGRDLHKAKEYAKELAHLPIVKKNGNKIIGISADANNVDSLAKILSKADVCLNCSQYTMNLQVMEACLKAKCNYLDLGGLFHMTLKQLKLNKEFKNHNLSCFKIMWNKPPKS